MTECFAQFVIAAFGELFLQSLMVFGQLMTQDVYVVAHLTGRKDNENIKQGFEPGLHELV